MEPNLPTAGGESGVVVSWIREVSDPTQEQEAVAKEITASEIKAAITSCKAGKAAGPDRLGNGWYREFASHLVPIFAVVLNKWYTEGVFPLPLWRRTFSV